MLCTLEFNMIADDNNVPELESSRIAWPRPTRKLYEDSVLSYVAG